MMKPPRMTAGELLCDVSCDGGVNLCDDPASLLPNQQSELLNLWHDGRTLTPRPGLVKKLTHSYGRIVNFYPKSGTPMLLRRVTVNGVLKDELYGIYIVTEHSILTLDGSRLTRVPSTLSFSDGVWTPVYQNFDLARCAIVTHHGTGQRATDASGNVWEIQGAHFCIYYGQTVLIVGPEYFRDETSPVSSAGIAVTMPDPYAPVIRRGCSPAGGGEAMEARNLLSPYVRQRFTTDNVHTVYRLFDRGIDNEIVTVAYDPAASPEVNLTFFSNQTQRSAGDLSVTLDRAAGTLTFSKALADAASYKITDNMEVFYSKTISDDCPVFHCTLSEWFGDGTGAGTRLFMAGNGNDPASVYYSANADPTYFPETCVLSVGDPGDPVTAFGRFYDSLIVFKRSAIYSIGLSGSQAAAAGVKPVDTTRGCDISKSIQLINDRLVFANTADGVLALGSTPVRDERLVVPVSRNVNPRLLSLDRGALAAAASADTGSRYLLFAGSRVFVWEYRRAPLPKVADDENLRALCWYLWLLPIQVDGILLYAGTAFAYDKDGTLYAFDADRAADDAGGFDAYFSTGELDFGKPLLDKRPMRCAARLTCQSGVSLTVTLTGGGDEADYPVHLEPGDSPALLRFEAHGRAPALKAGIRRAAGDTGRFGVAGFYLTAKPCGPVRADRF